MAWRAAREEHHHLIGSAIAAAICGNGGDQVAWCARRGAVTRPKHVASAGAEYSIVRVAGDNLSRSSSSAFAAAIIIAGRPIASAVAA